MSPFREAFGIDHPMACISSHFLGGCRDSVRVSRNMADCVISYAHSSLTMANRFTVAKPTGYCADSTGKPAPNHPLIPADITFTLL